jgi:hypothetical protein
MNHPRLFFRGRIDMNNIYGIRFILTILKQNQKFLSWSVHPDHTETESEISELINHADLHTQATSNNPLSNIQHDQNQNRKDNPNTTTEVRSPDSPTLPDPMTYSLPHRHNRGVLPNRYLPEIEGRKSKYSIVNFISARNMSDAIKVFMGKVSSEVRTSHTKHWRSYVRWTLEDSCLWWNEGSPK